MLGHRVVAAADLGEEGLWVGVKEGVVPHQESVEDDAQTPEVCRLPTVAARLQHLWTDVGRTAVTVCENI